MYVSMALMVLYLPKFIILLQSMQYLIFGGGQLDPNH